MQSFRLVLPLFLSLVGAAAWAGPPVHATPSTVPEAAQPTREQRVEALRKAHRFSGAERVYPIDDLGLRAQFQRTADALVGLQIQELRLEAHLVREVARYRTQRRTPPGPEDLRDLEPAHIPAVVLAKLPL